MIRTKLVAEELDAQTWAGMKIPFTVGPEQPEFAEGRVSGTVTKVPGGGLQAQATEEDHVFLVLVQGDRKQQDAIEQAMDALDTHLLAIANETRWGTYIQFVDRLGDPALPEFLAPETVLLGTQYQAREGRENG